MRLPNVQRLTLYEEHMKDYKKIWDSLSTTLADAAHFVGYQGDEDDIRANGASTASILRELLQIGPGDRVLEIGCGIARIGRELAPHCAEWHGADISGNMIRHARARTQDIPNVYLHELPRSDLGIFSDGYFDAVYSSIVFMHLDKIEMFRYIQESYRVLAPGGRAYFDTYNLLSPEGWKQFLDVAQTYSFGKRPGHVSQFSTPPELEKHMHEAKFESLHITGDNPYMVIGIGHKPAQADVSRPVAALRSSTPEAAIAWPSGDSEDDASAHEWKKLDDNLRAKNRYITELESVLQTKNRHIADLEQRVTRQQKAMSPRLVRIAMRLSKRQKP
jgi:SAM-dependent methyltransferase